MKPDCDCIQKSIDNVVKQFNSQGFYTSAYFLDQDLISGSLSNTIEIKLRTDVEKRSKTKKWVIIHSYCPFCGKKYK
jgi:hypothetical protein